MLNLRLEKNYIIEKVENAKKQGREVYIYGCGEIGTVLDKSLKARGICIDGFCVDKEYYDDSKIDKKIVIVDELLKQVDESKVPLVLIAFRDCSVEKLNYISDAVEVVNEDIFSFYTVDDVVSVWSKEFVIDNMDKFEKTYNELCDDKSKEVMIAFLNQKITGKFEFLKNIYETNQYYDSDIVNFDKIGSYVDCGAYDGDSFLSFIKNYEEVTGSKFSGKGYLLEPDEKNYEKMINNCSDYENVTFLKYGAWNKKDTLLFESDGTSSGIVEDGDNRIDVDTIDNLTNNSADFIKMDIEGAELCALQGAENTIKNNHPILAICVYHKSDDLWKIPEYIRTLDKNYKFYLRSYSKYTQELVLYAI